MLEHYLDSPITRRRLRSGPAADHINDFADWLHTGGYRRPIIVRRLRSLACWTDWLARYDHQASERNRNHEADTKQGSLLEQFVMKVQPQEAEHILQPLLDLVPQAPRELYLFFLGVTGVQDREPNTEQFWFIWRLFAARIEKCDWLTSLDDRHAPGADLLLVIFLGSSWKDGVRHWKSLEGYTAHLCMQDDIWDAPKRDRGRWMGDLDVSGRTIEDAFDDHFLMEDTLNRLIGNSPIKRNVNGIAGYSASWITGEAEYYRHTGSKRQLMAFHDRLIQLMQYMETELDGRNLYANNTHSWPFVDWSPELNGDTPEARRATQMEFYAAFKQGVYLLNQMGDTSNAQLFDQRAAQMKAAAQHYLLDTSTDSFGTRWQTNAIAVLSGVADHSQYDAIWKASLASVGHIQYNALIITPYYNYYVISATAQMNHRQAALKWIRQYWGGMVDEGATSFWEGYDPSWYKDDFHASLQADNMSGYRVSLAHGWSTGVMPWLMEQILGIHATGPGFSTVDIRPDLIDLQWAKGGEPTPRGMLNVSIHKNVAMETVLDLPPGTKANLYIPVSNSNAAVKVNGQTQSTTSAENGRRELIIISKPGHYIIDAQ
jgi:alpha-L-rhamnosidase